MTLEELQQEIKDLHVRIQEDSFAMYQLMRIAKSMGEEQGKDVTFDFMPNIKPLRELLA